MLKRYLAVAGLAVTIASTAAYAAGYFPGFPVIGGAAYCQGYSNYSTSVTVPGTLPTPNACNSTVPAGPANLAGTALIPADTFLSQGQAPQTVYVPAALTGATTQDAAPLTGATVSMNAGVVKLLLDPAGTIATLTVNLPLATGLVDGQEAQITSSQTVTALTVTPGTGATLVPTITTVSASSPVNLVWHAATAKWVNE